MNTLNFLKNRNLGDNLIIKGELMKSAEKKQIDKTIESTASNTLSVTEYEQRKMTQYDLLSSKKNLNNKLNYLKEEIESRLENSTKNLQLYREK
jgi:flagellar motility protein MotE (MotC chaperone)